MDRERPQTNTHAQLREFNLVQVMRHLKTASPLSRAQLADLTSLNKSTISSLTDELLSLNLIHETGINISGSGRPARMLEINPNAGVVVSCEFGIDFIYTIIADFCGNIVWRQRTEIEPNRAQDDILSLLLQNVDEANAIARASGQRLLGIGLSSTGMVDVEQGEMVFSPNLRWRNVPLKQLVEDHTQLPTFIENDSNAAALGEHFFGRAQNVNDFLFILADVGVGGGLFLNGNLYRGTSGFAGEIGHMILNLSNRPCRCGKRGCWEMEVNKASVVERARNLLEIGRISVLTLPLSFSQVVSAARAEDEVALAVLAETGRYLGLGIANLIDIFNPQLIVLGGSMSEAGEFLLPAIQATIAENALEMMQRGTAVTISAFNTDAVAIGAATLVIRAILANPKQVEFINP